MKSSHPCLEDGAVGFVFKLPSRTQEVKTLVSRPDNLGLIPTVHMVEERINSHKLSPGLHKHINK